MSTIDCAFHGFLAADPDARVSQNGNPWVRMRVGVGHNDSIQWISLACFGKAAEVAAGLKKGDRVYAEGVLKLDSWKGSDGVERHGLSVASFKIAQTHQIGRNRVKRDGDDNLPQGPASGQFDDPVPF